MMRPAGVALCIFFPWFSFPERVNDVSLYYFKTRQDKTRLLPRLTSFARAMLPALIALAAMLFAPSFAHAQPIVVRFVDQTAAPGGDGETWLTAYATLQQALEDTQAEEIWVAQGTYMPSDQTIPTDPRSKTFQLVEGVRIYGGFLGNETDKNQRDSVAHPTILSGDIGIPNLATDNCYHVLTAERVDSSALIDGFTVTGGFADNAAPIESLQSAACGGGIVIYGSASDQAPGVCQPTIIRCIFENNHADNGGGAAYLFAGRFSDPNFLNCTFRNNTADIGGAFYHDDDSAEVENPAANCSVILINCLFHDNSAETAGSALYSEKLPFPVLINCTVADNVSAGTEGAIVHKRTLSTCQTHNQGYVELHSCIVWGNTAAGSESVAWQIAATDQGALVDHSCVKNFSNGSCGDANTIASDPLFTAPASNNFRLTCSSPCINANQNSSFPGDTAYDIAQDNGTVPGDPIGLDKIPDLDLNQRNIAPPSVLNKIDMGCYELGPQETCPADIDPLPCPNGVVDIEDLTAVILAWGQTPCPGGADLWPPDIIVTCTVNIDDLTAVILAWGNCTSGFTGGGGGECGSGVAMMAGNSGDDSVIAADDSDSVLDLPTLTDILYNLPAGSSVPPDALQALLDLGIQP